MEKLVVAGNHCSPGFSGKAYRYFSINHRNFIAHLYFHNQTIMGVSRQRIARSYSTGLRVSKPMVSFQPDQL